MPDRQNYEETVKMSQKASRRVPMNKYELRQSKNDTMTERHKDKPQKFEEKQ